MREKQTGKEKMREKKHTKLKTYTVRLIEAFMCARNERRNKSKIPENIHNNKNNTNNRNKNCVIINYTVTWVQQLYINCAETAAVFLSLLYQCTYKNVYTNWKFLVRSVGRALARHTVDENGSDLWTVGFNFILSLRKCRCVDMLICLTNWQPQVGKFVLFHSLPLNDFFFSHFFFSYSVSQLPMCVCDCVPNIFVCFVFFS